MNALVSIALKEYLHAQGLLMATGTPAPEWCSGLAELLESCVYVVGTNHTHVYNLADSSRKAVGDFHDAHIAKRRVSMTPEGKSKVEQLSKIWQTHKCQSLAKGYSMDPRLPFGLCGEQLKQRRQNALDLTRNAMNSQGQMVGRVYVPKSPWENAAEGLAGGYMGASAAADEQAMEQQQRRQQQQFADELAAAPDEQSRRRILGRADATGLRTTLQQAFMTADEQRAARAAEAQLSRADKAEQRQLDREARKDEKEADRLHREALKAIPSQHITIRTGEGTPKRDRFQIVTDEKGIPHRVNMDTGEATPVAGIVKALPGSAAAGGSKGLTAKQLETQRGFMDMQSSLDNYEKLLDAYDFQGKTAIDPSKRAALEGAYTDVQMKLKTLYELGAPQAGDLKLLAQALPNPTDIGGTLRGAAFGSSPFKARLGETRKLLDNSRKNFETQFSRPTPEAAQSAQPQQSAPQEALDFLKANPNQAAAFKAKYGYLPKGY